MNARHEVKSLKKALRALSFMNQRGDTSVSDVARATGVPRPTAYRILETLASEGYVEKQPHSVFYRITSRVQGLAAGFQDEELLLEIAKPMVNALGQELGWPVTLYTPRGIEMVVRINTDHDCAMALERFNIGYAVPILDATSGYCYLAHCPPAEHDEILDKAIRAESLRPVVPGEEEGRYLAVTESVSHLIRFDRTRFDQVRYLVEHVRERGFCNIEFKQYREGNVGVPLALSGKPVGGLVMRYIKTVMQKTNRVQTVYVPRLQQLARDITDAYLARITEDTAARRPVRSADVIYPKFG
jgi:IclR family mhp operon transcriptional activator